MVTIVQAKPQYLSNIYSMILTLAKHDGWEHKIQLTELQLGQLLFCPEPKHFAGMAVVDDNLVGLVMFSLVHHNFCVNPPQGLYIETLFVSTEYRQQGIGTALFKYVAQKAKAENCSRIEWWVSRHNPEANDFYKKIGGIALSDWEVFKCDKAGIDSLLSLES